MMKPVTRNPIVQTIELRDGVLVVVSSVEVPEAPAEKRWMKLATVVDPNLPVRRRPGEIRIPLYRTPSERLGLIAEQLLYCQRETIVQTWDLMDSHGFDWCVLKAEGEQ